MKTRQRLLAAAVVAVMILGADNLLACPVCYGSPDAPMNKGINNAIWVLLGVVGFVQLGFVALFWTFWRRSKQLKKFREQFHVVKTSS